MNRQTAMRLLYAFVCIGWLSQEPGADCNHDSDLVSIQVQCTNAVVEADRGGAY